MHYYFGHRGRQAVVVVVVVVVLVVGAGVPWAVAASTFCGRDQCHCLFVSVWVDAAWRPDLPKKVAVAAPSANS